MRMIHAIFTAELTRALIPQITKTYMGDKDIFVMVNM